MLLPSIGASIPPRNRPNDEPGWYCFAKAGGCGAEFAADDQAITGQQTGRTPNPDICDQVNTLQKMSQKRAMIAAVLIGVNASEFFTQDVEDIATIGNGASYVPPVQVVNPATGEIFTPNPAQQNPRRAAILIRLAALAEEAEQLGLTVPDMDKADGKTDAELIAAGTQFKAKLDEFKRQRVVETPVTDAEPLPGSDELFPDE